LNSVDLSVFKTALSTVQLLLWPSVRITDPVLKAPIEWHVPGTKTPTNSVTGHRSAQVIVETTEYLASIAMVNFEHTGILTSFLFSAYSFKLSHLTT